MNILGILKKIMTITRYVGIMLSITAALFVIFAYYTNEIYYFLLGIIYLIIAYLILVILLFVGKYSQIQANDKVKKIADEIVDVVDKALVEWDLNPSKYKEGRNGQ